MKTILVNIEAKRNELKNALRLQDHSAIITLLNALRPPDQADIIDGLPLNAQISIISTLQPVHAADILEQLPENEIQRLVLGLTQQILVPVLDVMEPDDAADLLDELPEEKAEEILSQLIDKENIKQLIAYPDSTAGAIMTTDMVAIRRRLTCAEALDLLQTWATDREEVFYLFITDRLNRLVGVLNLFQLIQASPEQVIKDIMDDSVIMVTTDTDQEHCSILFQRYGQITLPVVDEAKHLVGVITPDDLVEVLQEETDEDFHRMGGMEPLEKSYMRNTITSMVRKRAVWLLVLFGAAILTTTIMASYEEQLEAVAILAVFIPLLIGTGGNSGAQTVTSVIRAMATGEIDVKDGVQVWLREIRVGLLLGLTMSVLAGLLALGMFSNTKLAATLSISIFFIVLTANAIGSILPILATKLKLDPALLSGPLIATSVDSIGLLIYFSVAIAIFGI